MKANRILAILLMLLLGSGAALAKKPVLPQKYYEGVSDLFDEGLWGEGKVLLDEGMKKYPDEPNLLYLAGRYWWHSRDVEKARFYLVKSVKIDNEQLDSKELLISVEESTGNYSSAICYVNELLQVDPYSKTLWLRKISLYRKQGNEIEAENRLRRLSRIYPHDEQVQSEYLTQLLTAYEDARREDNNAAMISALEEIVKIDTKNVDYQIQYINALMRQGYNSRALEATRKSLLNNPGNAQLLRKEVDILLSMGQNELAVSVAREADRTYRTQDVHSVYNLAMSESARISSENDPYQLYVRTYATNPSNREALDYLIRTSMSHGYYDEAEYYLREAIRRRGNSARYSMMLYTNYLRQGNDRAARRMLPEMAAEFPDSYDINAELGAVYMGEARSLMAQEDYTGASALLEQVIRSSPEEDMRRAAAMRLFDCYLNMNHQEQAAEVLDALNSTVVGRDTTWIVSRRAMLLTRKGRTERALSLLEKHWRESHTLKDSLYYANVYVETGMPYLKLMLENQHHTRALEVAETMVEMHPQEYDALNCAISCSRALGDSAKVDRYTTLGQAFYPQDLGFKISRAKILSDAGQKAEALELLRPELDEYPANDLLLGGFCGISDEHALALVKDKKDTLAMAVVDTALVFDPDNRALKYTKGLIFEDMHQYDSAHFYQKFYVPSNGEEREFAQHLNYLKSRSFHNTIDAGIMLSRFGDSYSIFGVGTVGWTHRLSHDEFFLRVNYTGRDYYYESEQEMSYGGRGLQGAFGWSHDFGSRWTASANAAVGYNYFPKVTAGIDAVWHSPIEWDFGAGLFYRMQTDGQNLFGLGLNAANSFEKYSVSAKANLGLLSGIFFVNGTGSFRYYPWESNPRTFAGITIGVGTAPELTILNYYYTPQAFNRLNSFVGLGGGILLAPGLQLGMDFTWHTLYSNTYEIDGNVVIERAKYRNLFNINASVTIYF